MNSLEEGENEPPEEPDAQREPDFDNEGDHFDTFLRGKNEKDRGPRVEMGNAEQILTGDPKDQFDKLFGYPDKAKRENKAYSWEDDEDDWDDDSVARGGFAGQSINKRAEEEDVTGVLSIHNKFVEHVCGHNIRLSATFVRLKILVFDAWLKFKDSAPIFGKKENYENKFDLYRFKEVMYYYRSDIKQDATALKSDKEAADKADFVERTFDLHLLRCWEVARMMNPAARDLAYKRNEDWIPGDPKYEFTRRRRKRTTRRTRCPTGA
jgi:hypothetical protein